MAAVVPAPAIIPQELYPADEDLLYEEEILRNPFSFKLWWRYLIARSEAPFRRRAIIYERALKALPGSYKLWHAHLHERLELVSNAGLGYESNMIAKFSSLMSQL